MASLIDFNSKKVKTRMGYVNGFGAAIVVIGALFKILHLPGGDFVIGAGLTTEAILFILGAFEPVPIHYHWENVHPNLIVEEDHDHSVVPESNLGKVSNIMSASDIDSELVSKLDSSINHFTEVLNIISNNSSGLSKLTEKTGEYTNKISIATENMSSLNNAYIDHSNQMSNQIRVGGEFVSALNQSVESADGIRNELEGLKNNLTSLNSVYGGMLSAMNR